MSGPTRIHDLFGAVDHQQYIDWVDHHIVNNSRWVVLLFLLLTGAFLLGMGNISTETGTQQFTTGLPSEEALQDVQREFSPSFEPDTGSTSLIQRETNVLSKASMLRMLRLQHRVQQRPDLRVQSTASVASLVAREIDPDAEGLDEQITALERATRTDVRRAVRDLAATSDRFTGLVSNDFNRPSASASATIGTISHGVPAGISEGSGQSGESPLTPIQQRIQSIEDSVEGDITVFGSGIVSEEFGSVLTDSLLLTVPAAFLLIVFFLVVAFRDLADLVLGIVALVMAIVWTFGFLGFAGIPFTQLLIAVPPLLLAVGIDFGIHAINRYREEHVDGLGVGEAMRVTTDQLTVAFFIVAGTSVIGFLANLTSSLPTVREFGVVAAIGIGFTFLIFGIFVPAAKVELDRLRDRWPIPTFATTPLGSEGSVLASVLQVGVAIARRAPALFLVVVVLLSVGAGAYATGVDTSFEREDFLPPENNPDFLEQLPEPFRPSDYTVTGTVNYLEDNFESTDQDSTTVYVEGPMTRGSTLEAIHRANENPPDSFLREGRYAETESIISVIESRAERDPEFRALVDRNDVDDDGIPDRNLREVYDALLDSPARSRALEYITDDYTSTQVVYSVETDAAASEVVADTRTVADRYRMTATATGQTVVFQAVSDRILDSAVSSLVAALVGAALFLVFIYLVLEGTASLGVANVVPVLVTVALVAGSMRALSIPFNTITATILAIVIGLGIDYSVHMVHRFVDERRQRPLVPALERTVMGTGGALFGSMLTTVSGIGVLSLAVFVAIQQFGLITALAVIYAFLTAVVVTPSVLVVWDHFVTGHRSVLPLFGVGSAPWQEPTPAASDVDLPDPSPAVVPATEDATTDGRPTANPPGDDDGNPVDDGPAGAGGPGQDPSAGTDDPAADPDGDGDGDGHGATDESDGTSEP
jgi:predicted RND superfamily exporter protein